MVMHDRHSYFKMELIACCIRFYFVVMLIRLVLLREQIVQGIRICSCKKKRKKGRVYKLRECEHALSERKMEKAKGGNFIALPSSFTILPLG